LIAAVGTGRDEAACRVGQFFGNFIKRICTVGWAIVGLIAATLVARGALGGATFTDAEEAFGFACRRLLFPGGIGLLIACFLAANMASCSAFMVDSGAMVTNGIYRKYLVKTASDRHYLQAGRIAGLLVIAAAVAYSVFFIQRILYAFLLTETMATFVGISVLGGIVWRRANRWGALASAVGALGVNFFLYARAGERLDYWSPAIFMAAFLTGIALLVIVSLATASESDSRLGEFFANLDLPSDEDGPGSTPPFGHSERSEESRRGASDKAAASGQALIIPNLFHLRRGARGFGLWRAYRTDLLGWLAGAGLVVILIAAVWLLLRLA
jgi:Na+/proline symporter